MATILTKKSDTASAVPLAADLTNAAGGAELAVNATDKRLFSKTSGGTVVELGTNPTAMAVVGNTTVGGTLGVTGATTLAGVSATTLSASSTVTLSGGTANGVAYLNGSKVVTSGSALTFNGTSLTIDGGTAGYLYGPAGELMIGEDASGLYIGNGGGGVPAIPILFGSTATTYQRFNAGGSEQMRLTSTGLVVGGTAATNTSSGRGNITINGSSSAILSMGTGGTAKGYVYHSGSDMIVNATTGTLALQANGNGALIDSSGNLGLGVTPKTWGSYFKAMQMGDYAAFANNVQDASAIVSSNAYNNDNTNWRYSFSSVAASRYEVSAGAFRWYTAPSGTAGNAITFTQAMTLDASNNLFLGTTSSSYTAANRTVLAINGTNSGFLSLQSGGTDRFYIIASSAQADLGTATNIPLAFTTNATERARIDSSGNFDLTGGGTFSSTGVYNNTTASAANVHVSSAGGLFFRSTSALKYKQDIRNLESMDIGLLRPVRYKSKCEGDDQTKDHLGLIADEAAEAGFEELVTRGENGEVEGFQYERLTVVLLKELQTLRQRVAQLEAQ